MSELKESAETHMSSPEVVAQPPLPIVDARFPSRIADGVWLITDKRIPLVPNIGIVEGDHTVLIIDCGLTSESGQNVLNAARAIAGKRELVLTVTHAHPEHTFGAQAFKGQAKIYYNRLQRDYLARNGSNLLAGFRYVLPTGGSSLLDDIAITLADEVYDGDHAVLDLGGRMVEFQTWGIAHSPGDQIISIPDQKITFVGDLIEERMFPIVPLYPPMIQAADFDLGIWEKALSDILDLEPRILVPGHGNLGGTELAIEMREYFAYLRTLTASTSKTVQQLETIVRGYRPTWERSEFIAPALRYLTGV
jgi:glyoxylase-like metal-dependent hydrolase (beta-lactamase superfamily II)